MYVQTFLSVHMWTEFTTGYHLDQQFVTNAHTFWNFMHVKLQTVIFDRHVSSLIHYLTNEFSPENCEEERMPLVLLYVIAILQLLTFALRVLCGQGIAALEYFGPELSFWTCVMLFCEFRAKIFVTHILLFGDLIGKIEKSYNLLALYLYSVTGNMIQVGLQGSFPVVYWVCWLIVFEFSNCFHLWDFKFLQWCSDIGAWCFKMVWWSPNIKHQSPSEIVSISQKTRPHLSVYFLTSHVLSTSCALTCLHLNQSSLVSVLWWNIYWQNMEFFRTFTSLIRLTSQI